MNRFYYCTKRFTGLCLLIMLFISQQLSAQTHAEMLQMYNEIEENLYHSILPFWEKHTVDPSGGFYGMVGRDGRQVNGASKGGVLNARILWTFSKAFEMKGDSLYLSLANRAQSYFLEYFIDKQYGGVYWEIKADGSPLNTDKQSYACAYGIYGLAEHFRATGNLKSLNMAILLYNTLEEKSRDRIKEGYIESFTRDWKKPAKYGYDGKGIASKTMNTHIHVLEAYMNLYSVWHDRKLKQDLIKLIQIFTDKLYRKNDGHLTLYCDDDWNSLEDIDSYGHDIETAWLLTEAADLIDDDLITKRCHEVTLGLTDAALAEGLTPASAMNYERNGTEYSRNLSWWCQAETIIGCVNAWQITGNKKYLQTGKKVWEYVREHFVDKTYGEWYRSLSESGVPVYKEPKVSLWNCPYHNSRVGYELERRNFVKLIEELK